MELEKTFIRVQFELSTVILVKENHYANRPTSLELRLKSLMKSVGTLVAKGRMKATIEFTEDD